MEAKKKKTPTNMKIFSFYDYQTFECMHTKHKLVSYKNNYEV